MKNEIIVGLDIGTTKISAIVGRKNEYDKLEILGMGRSESFGVQRGVVANIEKTTNAIKEAVAAAEETSGHEITEVIVGIAGQHIRSIQHSGIITRDSTATLINQQDIDRLTLEMHKLALPPGDSIIHVLPQEFIVDDQHGVTDPIGRSGVRLEADFHIITGKGAAISDIHRCVELAGLKVKGLVLEPLASAASVLSIEERDAGVAMVDIGGGTSDIAIFYQNIIRHTAVIPLGGNVVTEDIKEGCKVMRQSAEQLKVKFGSAVALDEQENQIVSVQGLKGRDPKEISVKNLSNIIEARMKEILEYVYYEINQSGFINKLLGGIVLTGGGSQLKHLKQLVEYTTGLDARIGYPTEHLASSANDLGNPMYATGIGLILRGFDEMHSRPEQDEKEVGQKTSRGWFKTIFDWGKKQLQEDDTELK
jgi:cell division protein FtsA